MNSIIWIGPVSTSNLNDVKLPVGWKVFTVSKELVAPTKDATLGLNPQDFRSFAGTLGQDKIGELLRRAGAEQAILASFSAGHGLLEELLRGQPSDPRIVGVLSADSYYGLAVKPGYKAFADSAKTGVPFILTTSNSKDGTITPHSGSESVLPFAQALEMSATPGPGDVPPPDAAMRQGSVLWLDYKGKFPHISHATVLAPLMLNHMLHGDGGVTIPPPIGVPAGDSDVFRKWLAFVSGAITGFVGLDWMKKSWKKKKSA